jgi:D-glycero-D-manno-heptose 1,7-bisphosphate phosphatase
MKNYLNLKVLILNKAIFLDRDGTINVDKDHLYKIEDFEFINGVPEQIGKWNKLGYLVIVVTNQAGVAKGLYTEADVQKLHEYINNELAKYEAHIDAFYFCPHHPEGKIEKYRLNCNCRKPGTGMLEKAIEDFDIDVNKSYLFGDKEWDIQAGEKVGLKSILVATNSFELNKLSF